MSNDDWAVSAYVLGVLEAEERAALERRFLEEAELRRLRDQWELHLAPLQSAVAPVTPPARVWRRIRQRMRPTPAPRYRWLAWPGLATAALVLAILGLNWRPPAPLMSEPLLLASEQAGLRWEVQWPVDQTEVLEVRRLGSVRPGEAEDHELWIILPEAATPQSLGLLPRSADARVRLSWPGPRPDATLAVSLEPRGGSPQSGPSGPVIAVLPLNGA